MRYLTAFLLLSVLVFGQARSDAPDVPEGRKYRPHKHSNAVVNSQKRLDAATKPGDRVEITCHPVAVTRCFDSGKKKAVACDDRPAACVARVTSDQKTIQLPMIYDKGFEPLNGLRYTVGPK